MKKYKVYNSDYQREPYDDEAAQEEFSSYVDAAYWAFEELPSDDHPYLIGTDDEIIAIAFQGRIYT